MNGGNFPERYMAEGKMDRRIGEWNGGWRKDG